MTRRPRGLRPEERELWHRVAATATPFHPEHPRTTEASKPKPKKPTFRIAELRIGETANPQPKGHDLAPSLENRLAAQPLRMEKRAYLQMTRGKYQPERRIDLHGMTQSEAHPELIRFILAAHRDGKRFVLVITGKGRQGQDAGPIPQRMGVLRHQVPMWLSQSPLGSVVLQIATAHVRHGGVGAFYVYLRRAP